MADRMQKEGYILILTINPRAKFTDNVSFEQVDYTDIGKLVDHISYVNFIWGTNNGPPAPVGSYTRLKSFLEYVKNMVPSEKIYIGIPVIGYNWELPYVAGQTKATSLTLNSVTSLAHDVGSIIQFDDVSQTPYFMYSQFSLGSPSQHIVWFVDARSVNAIMNLIVEYSLDGLGIWNIMAYYPQLWLVINSQYEIEKLI
jgi:spore germination protein